MSRSTKKGWYRILSLLGEMMKSGVSPWMWTASRDSYSRIPGLFTKDSNAMRVPSGESVDLRLKS